MLGIKVENLKIEKILNRKGKKHIRYEQYNKGILVENSAVLIHLTVEIRDGSYFKKLHKTFFVLLTSERREVKGGLPIDFSGISLKVGLKFVF